MIAPVAGEGCGGGGGTCPPTPGGLFPSAAGQGTGGNGTSELCTSGNSGGLPCPAGGYEPWKGDLQIAPVCPPF